MNAKKNQRKTRPPTESSGTSRQLQPISPATSNRILPIVGASLLGAGLIIAAIVAMTPLDDDELAGPPTNLDASAEIAAANARQPASQTSEPESGLPQPTTPSPTASLPTPDPQMSSVPTARIATADRPAKLTEFPTQRETIDVDALQIELAELAAQLQTTFSSDPAAFHFAAQIYFELKQTKNAEKSWRTSIERGIPASGPYAGLAEVLVNSGREPEAIDLLTQGHEAGIQSSQTFMWLSEAQENLGLLDDAKATLDTAIARYPKDADVWLARGRVLNQLKQYAAAESSIQNSLALAGDTEKALVVLSTAQARQRKSEQASETRDRITKLRSQLNDQTVSFQDSYESALRRIAVDVLLSSASLASENQRPADAERFLLRAISLDPNNGQTFMTLSSLLRSQGRMDEAYTVHKQLVKIQPKNPLNYVNLASLATEFGDWQFAKETLLTGVAIDPRGVTAQTSLVQLHLALGEFAEAKKIANQLLIQSPSVEAYMLLSNVFEASGETAAAASAIQQARILNPNHAVWSSLP